MSVLLNGNFGCINHVAQVIHTSELCTINQFKSSNTLCKLLLQIKEMNLETFARVSDVTRVSYPTDLKETSQRSENFLIILNDYGNASVPAKYIFQEDVQSLYPYNHCIYLGFSD